MWLRNEVCSMYTKGAASKCLKEGNLTLHFTLDMYKPDDGQIKRLRSFVKNGSSKGSPTSMASQMFKLIMSTCSAPYILHYNNMRGFIELYQPKLTKGIQPALEEMRALQVMLSSELAQEPDVRYHGYGWKDPTGYVDSPAHYHTRSNWLPPFRKMLATPAFNGEPRIFRKALDEIIVRHFGPVPEDVSASAMELFNGMLAGRKAISMNFRQGHRWNEEEDKFTTNVTNKTEAKPDES